MEEPKNNNEKGKNITILGSKSIAVPDVFKLDIMALLHKYKIREKGAINTLPLIKPL